MKKILIPIILSFLLFGCSYKNTQETIKKIIKQPDSIVLIFSSKIIGKYATAASNSVISYLLYKNMSFTLKTHDLEDESVNELVRQLNELKNENISKVILLITQESFEQLYENYDDLSYFDIYLPIVSKFNDFDDDIDVIFGSINYKEQIKSLLRENRNTNITQLYDTSKLGKELHKVLKFENDIEISKSISVNKHNYKSNNFITRNDDLQDSTLFLNTPIIKSSILLSQIHSKSIILHKTLSTQLNYTPLLLSLTQYKHRQNIIISNSIGKIPSIMQEYSAILGSELEYNWVNYSTVLGVHYLLNGNLFTIKDEKITDNEVKYKTKLYGTTKHSFYRIYENASSEY